MTTGLWWWCWCWTEVDTKCKSTSYRDEAQPRKTPIRLHLYTSTVSPRASTADHFTASTHPLPELGWVWQRKMLEPAPGAGLFWGESVTESFRLSLHRPSICLWWRWWLRSRKAMRKLANRSQAEQFPFHDFDDLCRSLTLWMWLTIVVYALQLHHSHLIEIASPCNRHWQYCVLRAID